MMEKFIGKKVKWTNKGTDKPYVADFFNTQYNLSYPMFVPNFKMLGTVVPEKSLTEKKFTHTYKQNMKLAASKAYSIPPARCRSKSCKFVKNYFFSIKLLHVHLQYVCNIPIMY